MRELANEKKVLNPMEEKGGQKMGVRCVPSGTLHFLQFLDPSV